MDDPPECLVNLAWWDTVSYRSLKTWVPTLGNVPKGSIHSVARLKRAIFKQHVEAKTNGNGQLWDRVWKLTAKLYFPLMTVLKTHTDKCNMGSAVSDGPAW